MPQTPLSITTDNSVNKGVEVAGNSTGFVAGWKNSSNQAVVSFSADHGQTWTTPVTFGDVESFVGLCAQNSNFLATWLDRMGVMPASIYTSLSSDGVTWGSPVLVSMGISFPQAEATSAATDAGFMTIWTQLIGMTNVVSTSFSPNGITWNSAVTIPTSFSPFIVDIAGNEEGFLAAITSNTDPDLGYVSFSEDMGVSWSPILLITPVANQTRLSVAGNSSGFLTAWIDMTTNQVFTSFSSDNGQNWTTPVQVSTTPGDASTTVSIGANNDVS